MCNPYINRIKITKGDITKEEVDAIVNAANSGLLGGSGVDGAIHRAGGAKILEECKSIINKIGSLKTGEAVITSGGNLKAKYVIHTVGPIWKGGNSNEEILLSNAYKNSLRLASEKRIKTIAFPSISTGVYGYPKELAAKVSYRAVKESLKKHKDIEEVRLVCFDDYSYRLYDELLLSNMKEEFKPLIGFIPYFESKKNHSISWGGGGKNKDGIITMPYPEYDEELINFVMITENTGIMVYNYLDFLKETIEFENDANKVIENADIDKLRAVLTYYVRQERFCDGLWGRAVKDNIFLNILYRLNEILYENK